MSDEKKVPFTLINWSEMTREIHRDMLRRSIDTLNKPNPLLTELETNLPKAKRKSKVRVVFGEAKQRLINAWFALLGKDQSCDW